MFSAFKFCYAVLHSLCALASLFSPGMEILHYYNKYCALTNYELLAGLIVYRLCIDTNGQQSHSVIKV